MAKAESKLIQGEYVSRQDADQQRPYDGRGLITWAHWFGKIRHISRVRFTRNRSICNHPSSIVGTPLVCVLGVAGGLGGRGRPAGPRLSGLCLLCNGVIL